MTVQEMRETKDYKDAVAKIEGYEKGFTFTLNYAKIPKPKANALKIITMDCINNGIIESISFDLDFDGNTTGETFRRL